MLTTNIEKLARQIHRFVKHAFLAAGGSKDDCSKAWSKLSDGTKGVYLALAKREIAQRNQKGRSRNDRRKNI